MVIFALLAAVGAAWALATPLMTGADESDHAIRAAAVARGQVVGGETHDLLGSANVFIEVEVPEAYGQARGVSNCFIDFYPDDNPVDQSFGQAETKCLSTMEDGGSARVRTTTLQYRGQPTYYAVVGLPTLVWPDATGVAAMRIVSGGLTAALLAAALVAARSLPHAPLLPVAVLAGATPVCLWLGGQVNSGGFEIAAALWLWTSALVATRARTITRAMIAQVGVAFVLLTLCRGLSPVFGIVVLVVVALTSDRRRLRTLTHRDDVRRWALAGGLATLTSAAWLAFIQLRYPLDDRPGTGVVSALGSWDWYLRQAVGVFGVNDIILPLPGLVAWGAVVAVIVGAGLQVGSAAERVVVPVLALAAFALNITADGMSLPPIGYYWQGRYVLPLLVGVAVLAAGAGLGRNQPTRRPSWAVDARFLAAILWAVQVWSFAFVTRHFAGRGKTDIGFLAAWRDPVWSPPLLPAGAWTALYAVSLGAVTVLVVRPHHSASSGDWLGQGPSIEALDPADDPHGA